MKRRLAWFWFVLRYKLGLASPGIDFEDVAQGPGDLAGPSGDACEDGL